MLLSNMAAGPLVGDKYLIVAFGESNSGGVANNAHAASWEVAARPELRMWNVTTGVFEDLDIGTNNNLDHNGLTSATHGWELGLANRIRQGYFDRPVYYLQTGQGSSDVSEWAVNHPFWITFLTRVAAVKAAISRFQPVVWISLGINDAVIGTPTATFKAGLIDIIARIKALLPLAKIYMTTLPPVDALHIANSVAIQEVAAADPTNLRVIDVLNPVALPMGDTYHWNYIGQRRLAARFVEAMADDFPLTPKWFPLSAQSDAGHFYVTAANQYGYVTTTWTKATFPGIKISWYSTASALPVVIDGDVSAIAWGGTNDDYYGGVFQNSGPMYGTTSNGQLNPASTVGAMPNWARLTASGDDLILALSNDGGTTWTPVHTYTNALAAATDVRVKMLSASFANETAVDVWTAA